MYVVNRADLFVPSSSTLTFDPIASANEMDNKWNLCSLENI